MKSERSRFHLVRRALCSILVFTLVIGAIYAGISAQTRGTHQTPVMSLAVAPLHKSAEAPETLSITQLSPYIIGNAPLMLGIRTNAPLESTIHIDALSAKNTRSELYTFADNLGKSRVRDSMDIALSQFAVNPDDPTLYTAAVGVNGDGPSTLSFPVTGIYPIAVSVVDPTNSTSKVSKTVSTQYSFITYLPAVGSTGSAYAQRLRVAPLLKFAPFVDRTAISTDEKSLTRYGLKMRTLFARAQMKLTNSFATGVPTSIVLSPEAFDTYKVLNSFDTQAASSSLFPANTPATSEYIADTYVPINIGELDKEKLSSEIPDSIATGRTHLNNFGVLAPARTLVTQSMTQASIDQLTKAGIDHLIVDDSTFANEQSPTSNPVSLSHTNSSLAVVSATTSVAAHLPSTLSESAQANYLLAATSVIALEAPSVSRGVVLPLNLTDLTSETLDEFLNGLTNNPLVAAITTSDFFTQLSQDNKLAKKLEKGSYPKNVSKSVSRDDYVSIENFSTAAASIYPVKSGQNDVAQWMALTALSRSDRNASRVINPSSARELVISTRDFIQLPQKRTLTLTSHENKIPVTIRNSSPLNLSVVVQIRSDKLAFPQGSEFPVTLRQENTTVQIPVKARTTGSFPIFITVVSPKNAVIVTDQAATVRSTAFSGAGVAIAIASALFLALWWISHARKTRKKTLAPVIEITHDKLA